MLKIDSNYKSPFIGDDIDESETYDNKINDPLFTKVAKRLKKEIDYPKKPAAKGYPNEAPPKIDPNSGYHPKFGKRYKYDKLDPISAKTMAGAPTGDPEIDANVKKAAKVKEDWRSDLKNLWLGSERKDWKKKIEEDFVNTTQGMKVGQTFRHDSTGATFTSSGGLGGVESTPKTATLDLGLDGKFTVDAPSYNQYGLQGFAKPIDIMRRGSNKKAEQLNKELDSSEEYTKKVKADKFMKARVEEKYSEENEMKIVDSLFNSIDEKGNVKDQKVLKKASDYNLELKNNQAELNKRVKEIEEYRVKQTEWEKESERNAKIINSRIQSNISKVKSFVGRYGEKLSDTFPMGASDIRIAQGGTKLVVISHSGFNYDDSKKFNVRVFDQYVNPENGKREKIGKIKGNFGITSEDDSLFRNPFGKVSGRKGQATIQYVGVGDEIENRYFEIKDIESKPMPKIPPYLMKNQALGWYNAPQSITSNAKNKIMTGDFARNVLGAIGSLISSIPGTDRQGYEGDIEYAAKLTKDMMDGNLTVDKGPQSKSFNKRLLGLISKNPDRNYVSGDTDYANDKINAIKELPVRLAIQSFNWNATEEGIVVNDSFDFDINISGGALSGLPLIGGTIQKAIKAISDAMRMRSVELGFNQVESKYSKTSKKLIYNNMPSPEFMSAPVDDMMFRSVSDDGAEEAIKKSLGSNTSPDGFDKDIRILIPWSQVAKDAPALMSKKPTGSSATKTTSSTPIKEPSKAVQTVKNMASSKSVGFDREDLSFKKKKNFREWSQQLDDMWNSDWRDELKEGMTTSDTFSYSKSGRGDTDLATTGTGYSADGVHQLQNIPPMTNVDDPTNVGKKLGGGPIGAGYHNVYGGINQYDGPSQEAAGQENTYWNQAVDGTTLDNNTNPRYSDYIYPFDRAATGAEIQTAKDASQVRGAEDVFRATYPTNVFGNRHKATPVTTNPTVGVDDDYDTVGLGVRYGGAYDNRTPRFFVPAGVNTSEIDTVKILASVDTDGQGRTKMNSAGSQLQLFYWAGDKPGFQSLQNKFSHASSDYPNSNRQYDGWRPIAQKPNGEIDSSVSSNIIDNTKPVGFQAGKVNEFTLQIPEWCRSTNTRFMFIQMSSSDGGPTIYSIRYQRRNALTINTTLADEKASAFVRVGNNSQMSPEERKKKLNDMLKASREYMLKSLGFASLFNDEVKISDVVSSNFDFQSVMQGSGAFGNSRFNDLVSLEKRQAAAEKNRSRPKTKSRRGRFRGYQRTGRDSKGMTTRARVNPNDIIGSI